MDLHAVPFPTTHHEDPCLLDKRPPVPPRLHPTPSLPNLLKPHHYSLPNAPPLQGSARHRPHLRPLDLASSPGASPIKIDLPEFARRAPTLLTPPLTPSSSFGQSTSNDTPSTPPDPHSPLRWVSTPERERIYSVAHSHYTAGLKAHMSASTTAQNGGYLTPTSARSQSLSSDEGSGGAPVPAGLSDVSSLASGLASVEVTPRDERTFILEGHDEPAASDLDIGETSSEKPSRLVLVRNVPSAASSASLLEAFSGTGDVKGILTKFQASHGVVILAFYDSRHAVRALRQITGNSFPTLDDVRLAAAFVSPAQVEKLTGKSVFIAELDGSFFVTVEARDVSPKNVQNMLASFGELAAFSSAGTDPLDQTFHVDFYDSRDAQNAHTALNKRTMNGARLTLISNKDVLEHPVRLMQPDARATDSNSEFQRVVEGRVRPRSVSASEGVGTLDAVRKVKAKEVSQDHGRRSSNDKFFDAVGKGFPPSHAIASRPRSISASAEDLAGIARMHPPASGYVAPAPLGAYPYPDGPYHGFGHPPPVHMQHMYPATPYPYPPMYGPEVPPMYGRPEVDPAKGYWTYAVPSPPQIEYFIPPGPRQVYPVNNCSARQMARTTPEVGLPTVTAVPPVSLYAQRTSPVDTAALSQGGQRAPGAKNLLDMAAIENGTDTRTTVMIKNIPNKMTDKDLKSFIDRVCPRRIDFMYLRMDFQNGCNVGYAFVNFITVQDLLLFAKTQIGVKWNMYSSEKTLHMCYATYQGKESLVEKFKNSCIMDEKEAWRPKIYYSDGPQQGLPEPFPPATHLRRKERSQHNRGALFVPGTHHQTSGGGALYHHRPHPPRMSGR